jgi:hypothetical protein
MAHSRKKFAAASEWKVLLGVKWYEVPFTCGVMS